MSLEDDNKLLVSAAEKDRERWKDVDVKKEKEKQVKEKVKAKEEEKAKDAYINIDESNSEKKTYLDSELFEYQGVTYKYQKIADMCEEFLESFKKFRQSKGFYFEEINLMMNNHTVTLVIDYEDIITNEFLYRLIVANPRLLRKAMRKASFEILQRIHYDYAKEIQHDYKVTFANAIAHRKEITEINHSDVGHLVYTEDFVLSVAEQKDYTKRMAWYCEDCGRVTYKDSIGFQLPRIRKCMWCSSENITASNKDAVTDTVQEIKIQQRFERMESGSVPKTMYGFVVGKDMIDMVRPGDICAITGVVDITRNPAPFENAVADYVLDILWIEKIPDTSLIDDPELETKVASFIDDTNEDAGYQTMVDSIAPSVMGHEIIKEALLLQIVGSDTAWFRDNSRHRGESNILLVGDAGTAKTKLGKYVYQIYPRASYTAGNVSEAGMTAAVDVTNKSGHQTLTAGAYLLASSDYGGICVCDEMEKTELRAKGSTASCLDDAQMLEIHKGNIHQSIQINCASLHIANPKTGDYWNPELSIKENTGFENWYLSRFCTWIVRDIIDKELDISKSSHYLAQFGDTVRQNELEEVSLNELRRNEALLSREGGTINSSSSSSSRNKVNRNAKTVPEMRMYLKYARTHFRPRLDPKSKVAKKLHDFYVSVRPMTGNTKGFRITMRSLGDLVRFTEQSARAHFRNYCTEKDAEIAIKLVSSSIASSGFNMFTGEYENADKKSEEERAKLKGIPFDRDNMGLYTAQQLLENKTAREMVSHDIQRMAMKRQNRFYKDVGRKMKKVIYVIKKYALMKCRDCGGDGYRREGQATYACYSCTNRGGFKQPFQLSEINYQLLAIGFSNSEIQEMITALIKKKVILPKFNDSNTYELQKEYKEALLELTAIETQIELVIDVEQQEHEEQEQLKREQNIRNPEIRDRIHKIRNLMNPKSIEDIKKKLGKLEDDLR